jgi:tetratricopeptide (TPR) repeat protein
VSRAGVLVFVLLFAQGCGSEDVEATAFVHSKAAFDQAFAPSAAPIDVEPETPAVTEAPATETTGVRDEPLRSNGAIQRRENVVLHRELGRFNPCLLGIAVVFERGYAINNESRAEFYRERGRAQAGLKRDSAAIGSYDRAIGLDPGRADTYMFRASAKERLHLLAEALEDLELALKSKPRDRDRQSILQEKERIERRLSE